MVKITGPLQSLTARGTYGRLLQFRTRPGGVIALATPTRRAPLPRIISANAAYVRWIHTWINLWNLLNDPDWIDLAKTKNLTVTSAIVGHALDRWQNYKSPLKKPNNPDQPKSLICPNPLYATGYPTDRPHLRRSGAADGRSIYFHLTTPSDPTPAPHNFVAAVWNITAAYRFAAPIPAISSTIYYFAAWTPEAAEPMLKASTPLP